VGQGPATGEKNAQAGDEKGRESEQGKDWQQREGTHFLEMRRGERVREARTSETGKAHTS
jgi:hypothetical protein